MTKVTRKEENKLTNWSLNKLLFKNERDHEAFKKVMVNSNNEVDFDMIVSQIVYLTLTPSSMEKGMRLMQ